MAVSHIKHPNSAYIGAPQINNKYQVKHTNFNEVD